MGSALNNLSLNMFMTVLVMFVEVKLVGGYTELQKIVKPLLSAITVQSKTS